MLIKEVLGMVDQLAPFDTADEYDNVGLLVGDLDAQVTGIMLSLDVTEAVLGEMEAVGANLLITHHPLMFKPIRRLLYQEHESRLLMAMLRKGIHLICAHTNWDKASGGVNDALAMRLGLTNICGQGYVRVGELDTPQTAAAFAQIAREKLCAPVVLMGDGEKTISRVCVSSGAASVEWVNAAHADAFLTGEIRHQHVLEATAQGLVLLEAGHFATENPGMDALRLALQTRLNGVKCNVAVYRTKNPSYPVC